MYHLEECSTGQEINFEGGCSDCKLDKYQPVDMPTSTDKCLSCKENYGTKQKMSNSCLREFYLLGHSSYMVFFVGKKCTLDFYNNKYIVLFTFNRKQ